MVFDIIIEGGYFAVQDHGTLNEIIRKPRAEVTFEIVETDVFQFSWNVPSPSGGVNRYILGANNHLFAFADLTTFTVDGVVITLPTTSAELATALSSYIGFFFNPNPIDVVLIGDNATAKTVFDEQLMAFRSSQMNFKPTWGISDQRYATTTTGTGATVNELNGEFRLQTGTTATNVSFIETNQRGQYQAGAMGQSGVGFRVPVLPTGTQYAKWGYSDFVNSGFYMGVDVTGIFVAYLTGGAETKIYQTAWNGDKLDGTGASGLTLNLANGGISQIDFTWYGYGDIMFSFIIFNPTTLETQKVKSHILKIDGSASIIDPNQPLKFEIGNGASSTTDLSLYIGGHQFSIVDGFSVPQKRLVSELLTNYTTVTNTAWQPLIAFRKKATFNGRPNSVNVRIEQFILAADGEAETRITIGGTTSNLAWGAPTGVLSTETSIETKITTSGLALTTSSDGTPIDYGYVEGSNKASNTFIQELSDTLGAGTEIILWVRRLSGTGAVIVKHAHITCREEW